MQVCIYSEFVIIIMPQHAAIGPVIGSGTLNTHHSSKHFVHWVSLLFMVFKILMSLKKEINCTIFPITRSYCRRRGATHIRTIYMQSDLLCLKIKYVVPFCLFLSWLMKLTFTFPSTSPRLRDVAPFFRDDVLFFVTKDEWVR